MFEKYLKAIGVNDKTINAIKKAIEDKDDSFDLKPHIESFQADQKKLIENDEDFVKSIQIAERGKVMDINTRKLKTAFGLDASEIKDKSYDEVVTIAKAASTKGMDSTLKEEQQKNIDLTAKLKELEETTIPKIKGEVETEKKMFKIKNKVRTFFKEEDLRVPLATVEKGLNSDFYDAYDLDMDENEDVQIFTKGKRLSPKSKDGTKILTAKEVLEQILKENQFVKESNADDTDQTDSTRRTITPTKTKPSTEEEKKIAKQYPHLEKAKAHAESLKTTSAAPAKK